jgi:polyhydroxyalkanoate synthesis regulator phasin
MLKKKTLFLGVAGAVAVAGGGVGFAATRGADDSKAIIEDAAGQLGVTPAALTNALKTALKHRVDAAVAAGRLTKEQGDALKARIDSGDVPFLFGGFGLHHHGFGHFLGLDAAASYLGLTEAQLRQQLAGGKTLAQVAKDRGQSVSGLVDAMTKGIESRLDDAVADGRLTRAQANRVLKDVKQRVTDRVNAKAPAFRDFHGFRGFHGFRDFHGFREFHGFGSRHRDRSSHGATF